MEVIACLEEIHTIDSTGGEVIGNAIFLSQNWPAPNAGFADT